MMKKLFSKAVLLAAVGSRGLVSTACNDDEGGKGAGVRSELAGSYAPAFRTVMIPGVIEEPSDFYFLLLPTWSDPDNIPAIDLSASMGMPEGSYMMPVNTICGIVQGLVSNIVRQGLVSVDLKDDGTFGASYHEITNMTDDVVSALFSPEFAEAVSTFPSAETAELLPEGALGYYTSNGMFYFTISKSFLTTVGQQMETPMDLVAVIDEMLAQYGGLNIVSTKTEYAIPLKYKEENGVVELYADLAMIRPFAPLLDDLLGSLGDEAAFMGIKLADIVRLLLENTSELEIGLLLQRI